MGFGVAAPQFDWGAAYLLLRYHERGLLRDGVTRGLLSVAVLWANFVGGGSARGRVGRGLRPVEETERGGLVSYVHPL